MPAGSEQIPWEATMPWESYSCGHFGLPSSEEVRTSLPHPCLICLTRLCCNREVYYKAQYTMLQDLYEREFQLQCACRVVNNSSHVHHAQRLEGLQVMLRDAIDELWVAFEIAKHCDAVFTTPPFPSSEQEIVGGHIEGAKDELQQAQSGGTSAEFETTKDGHQDINDEKGDGKGKSV